MSTAAPETPPPVDLRIGDVCVPCPLSLTPEGTEWMAYFDLNETRYAPILTAACNALSAKYDPKTTLFVMPASSLIACAYIMRTRGFACQIVWKKLRPSSNPATTLSETYAVVTGAAGTASTLYFEGFDDDIPNWQQYSSIVVFDNVATTGATLAAVSRLLRRFDTACKVTESCVIFTEGIGPAFSSVPIDEHSSLALVSLGGHIPLIPVAQSLSASVELRQRQQFFFRSSARFPTHWNHGRNVQFSVFETPQGGTRPGDTAISVVGPNTFAGAAGSDGLWRDVVVRVHDACITSECFHSTKCDCREQLEQAMQHVCSSDKGGIVVYLFQEGRGIGIANKVKAYFLQQMAVHDTVEANRALGLPDDAREYVAVRDILNHFKVSSVKLMTNNPRKVAHLKDLGINVSARVPAQVVATSPAAAKYLHDKAIAMGHMISEDMFREAYTPHYSANPDTEDVQTASREDEADGVVSVVRFYEPEEDYGFLSNFYPSPIAVGGETFPTVEHYYQSRKFVGSEEAELVRAKLISAATPADCFALSREHATLCRPDWHIHRKRDMFRGLIHKFKQYPVLREQLLSTGSATIVENSPTDVFWGCGADHTGENVLGRMLMNIRTAAREHIFDNDHPLEYERRNSC